MDTNGRPILLTIKVLGGETVMKITMKPEDTVQNMFDKVCEKLQLNERKYFGICELIYDDLNAPLDRFLEFEKTIEGEGITELSELKFQIKHIKRPKDFSDPVAENLFFKHIQSNIVNEVYPCPEKLAVLLASLTVQILFGNHDSSKHRVGYLNKVGLNVFLPRTVSRHDYAYWQERLFSLHTIHGGLSKQQAMKKYIEIASTIPYFGMSFFEVKDDGGSEILLGVAEDGIFFFSSQNLKLIQALSFAMITSWKNYDEDQIAVEFVDQNETHNISIVTTPTKRQMITSLMDEYYALLPEKLRGDIKKPNNPKPFLLNESKMYLDPVQRVFLGRFGSRLEYLKGYYMECCALGKETPIRKFCQAIDRSIDREESFKEVDLEACNLTDSNITFFTKSVLKALDYKPERSFPWKENVDIETLNLSGNNIKAGLSNILDLLRQLKKLKHLNLSGSPIGDDGAVSVGQNLTVCSDLRSAILADCNIGNKGFIGLFEALKWKKNLNHIGLSKNNLSGQVFAEFGKFLETNLSLTHLDFSNNPMDNKGIEALLKALENNKNVERLNLGGVNLGQKSGLKVASLLEVNHNIKDLVLCDTKITPEVMLKIGRACRTNFGLEKLNISRNALGKGMDAVTSKEICLFLSQPNSTLREIDFSDCMLDFVFGGSLTDCLKNNRTLTKLNISGNNITKAGALHENWSDALRRSQIEILNLSRCGMKTPGFLEVVSSYNRSLKELYLGENDPREALKSLESFISKCQLTELYLNKLKITDSVFSKLGFALENNKSLELLNLSGNEITKEGVEEFIQHIKKNTTLKTVYLNGNSITESAKASLSKQFNEATNIDICYL